MTDPDSLAAFPLIPLPIREAVLIGYLIQDPSECFH